MKKLLIVIVQINLYLLLPLSCSTERQVYRNTPPPQKYDRSKPVTRKLHARPALDLSDQESSGSLWTGPGKEGNLFSADDAQKNGDVIQVHISSRLQNQILVEIRRDFQGIKEINIDRMVAVIIQRVNELHLLIRGRKTIYFGQRAKLIEIQALVAKRDIDYNNIVNSDKFLETTVKIIR